MSWTVVRKEAALILASLLIAHVFGSEKVSLRHSAVAANGLRGSSSSHEKLRSSKVAMNPLIGEYRREAREYETEAANAEAASAAWASKTRAAVYGGGALTAQNTQMELNRRGFTPWARATWAVEKMLRDPSSEKAEAAAQKAAAPYEQRYRDYLAAQAAYNASSQGFATRADQDEQMAEQMMSYATQFRMQGDAASAEQYVQRAMMLRRQGTSYQDVAAKYQKTANTIQVALPTIQRLAETAARYASWQENPKGAVAPKDVFPYTLVPPSSLAAPAPAPAWSFQGQTANQFAMPPR